MSRLAQVHFTKGGAFFFYYFLRHFSFSVIKIYSCTILCDIKCNAYVTPPGAQGLATPKSVPSNLETLLDQRGQTLSVTPSTVTDPSGVKANILEVISVKNGQLYIVDSVLSPKTS